MADMLRADRDISICDTILAQTRRELPVIERILTRFGAGSIAEYFKEISFSGAQPLQSPDDLLESVATYVAPVLGERIARELIADLKNYPVILTANHHGVDYFAQSFQGSLLFFLYLLQNTGRVGTVPIFSCGGVPLSNSSYPKGLLIYNAIQPDTGEIPFKLPIFPNNLSQTQVLAAPRFSEKMIQSALRQLEKNVTAGLMPRKTAETAWSLLNDEYLNHLVLEQPDYSRQVMTLNNRLCKRIFHQQSGLPEFVYIEFEAIASLIIKKDLLNTDSLAYRVFFDEHLREKVLDNLDGKRGCWNLQLLSGLLNGGVLESPHVLAESGTAFFWGLDILGRRVPLTLIDSDTKGLTLAGRDGLGKLLRISFTPADIAEALEARRIYPDLFTMFMVVSLARGLECVGGYFQGDYLFAMQQGLIQGLQAVGDYQKYAAAVAGIATRSYLSGMMILLARSAEHLVIPAGPLEIIEKGGMDIAFLKELQSISVDAAHRFGLFNIYPDLVSRQSRIDQWQRKIAVELGAGNPIGVLD